MDIRRLVGALRFSQFFWVVCALLLVLNIVFYAVFIKGQRQKIIEMEKIYTAKRELNLSKKNGTARYLEAKDALETFKGELTPKTDFAETVKALKEILDGHGLKVSGLTYNPANQPEGPLSLWKYTASFTVNGSYGGLKRLLADIQNAKDLFCIEGLSIEGRSKDSPEAEMKLKIASYYK